MNTTLNAVLVRSTRGGLRPIVSNSSSSADGAPYRPSPISPIAHVADRSIEDAEVFFPCLSDVSADLLETEPVDHGAVSLSVLGEGDRVPSDRVAPVAEEALRRDHHL